MAEKKYYIAESVQEKIKALEEMLRTAPSHKGAESLRAGIKQKLAKCRELLDKEKKQKSKGRTVSIKKEGAAQVVLVSVTNSGKSLLLSKLTNAKPEVANYEYTTQKPEVGIMEFEGVKIQVVEMPAISEGYAYRGSGRVFFSIIRNTDLVVFVIDSTKSVAEQLKVLKGEFEKAQIKLNEERPPIKIKKMGVGGIVFYGREYIKASDEELQRLLRENGIHNATISFYDYTTIEDFTDALNESLVYLPYITVYNKVDVSGMKGVSALTGVGIDDLKEAIWKHLGLIRVFTKSIGRDKDWPPITLEKGANIGDLARIIHKDFIKKFNFARVWGKSAKFPGQKVGLGHRLEDMDIVEVHLK